MPKLNDAARSERITMTITIDNLTVPQAIALRVLFEQMKHLGGMGSSRWVRFYADGDGNFQPKPAYTFSHHGPFITAEGERGKYGAWKILESDCSEQFSIDFDEVAWKIFHDSEKSDG